MATPVLFLTPVSSACKQQLCSAYSRIVDKISGLGLSQPRQSLLAHRHGVLSGLYVIIVLCMSEAWLKWR